MFGGSIKSWDLNKVRLAGWCRFYDGIKSAFDVPPPEDIYYNDYKLDAWVKKKRLERDNKIRKQTGSDPIGKGSPRSPADSYDSSVIKQ